MILENKRYVKGKGNVTMAQLEIRNSRMEDLPRILEIYSHARDFMVKHDNPRQWGMTQWPPEDVVLKDIEDGTGFVCVNENLIEAVFHYRFGYDIEPVYRSIRYGSWSDSQLPYGVIHRIAVDSALHGVGSFCIEWAFRESGYLRIDTHPANYVMKGLLNKLGFRFCGIINVEEDSDDRLAYDRLPG